MKKEFNIGDLVEGGFRIRFHDYGFGIIIQKKRMAPQVNTYRVHWSNNPPTWESERHLTSVIK